MSSTPTENTRPWSVLDNRLFRTLWIASVASGIGSTLHDTAAVWTMTTLTRSATLVTLMQTVSSLPLFLLALPAGALADMVDRRKVLLAAQIGSLAVTTLLVGLSWAGMLTPSLLLGVTFVLGIGVAFTLPTWQALLAEIVERKELPGALTLGSVGVNISRALGPIIAGVLLAASGPTAAFALNAISFVGLIIVLARVKRPERERGAHTERMIGAMIASLRFTRHSPVIQAVLIRNAGFTFFGIAPVALLPLIVRQRELAAADFGMLMGVYGVGGITAAFLSLPKLRKRFSPDAILTGGTLVFVTAAICLSSVENRVAMGFALFFAGSAWLVCMSTLAVAAQSAFPDWVRARSSAIYLITVQSAMATGALVWGQVTAATDPAIALLIASAGLLATLVLSAFFRIGAAMTLNLKPSAHWKDHAFGSELGDDDGPVVISLEYRIPAATADAFRSAIAVLRSIRLRDGAYRWFLQQDLEQPDRFFEVFHVGSWGEHLRQHQRATEEDRRVEEKVMAFHSGDEPPAITHRILRNFRVH